MTMSNAQAALIAASNAAVRGSAVPLEPVLKRAAAYLQWLEAQDKPVVPLVELRKVEPITQCKAASTNYTPCLRPEGHEGEHRNSTEGEYWGDEPARRAPVVHFLTDPNAQNSVCGVQRGRTENGTARVTILPRDVSCPTCKEVLGL